MRNVSMNVYAKFRCAPLRIKKALDIFRELIRTTRVAFWDPPFESKKEYMYNRVKPNSHIITQLNNTAG